jgi:hypothetical protein
LLTPDRYSIAARLPRRKSARRHSARGTAIGTALVSEGKGSGALQIGLLTPS